MNGKVRQFHRWVAVAFTLIVVAYIVVMSTGTGAPPEWLTYLPLLPLALLQLTGLYLLVQSWRGGGRQAG
jgi:hypothetical protein